MKATEPREGSKKQIVLDLLRRNGGATLAEIAQATGSQKHSIRGFISGALGKKMGLVVESSKNDVAQRTYLVACKSAPCTQSSGRPETGACLLPTS